MALLFMGNLQIDSARSALYNMYRDKLESAVTAVQNFDKILF